MGIKEKLLERIWGRERDLRVKGWTCAGVCVVASGVCSYYTYSFVKRFLLAHLLRNVPKKRITDCHPGDYVKVTGQVTTIHPEGAGAAAAATATAAVVPKQGGGQAARDPAEYFMAPKAQAPCVLLHAVEYRVVEEMDRATTRFNKSKAKGRSSVDVTGGGLEYTKDLWREKNEVVKEVKRALPCYLVDPTAGGPLALDEAGAKRKTYISLDLGGDPLYLELETVFEEFKPVERTVEMRSSRRTLGYREVEKVLPLNAQVLVFGEVGIKEGTEAVPGKEQLVIQRPATRHMFDRKTARTKPFVITMMGETELLAKVESRARIELYIAAGTGLLALITGALATRNFQALQDLLAEGAGLAASAINSNASSRSGSGSGWGRSGNPSRPAFA